MRGTRALADGDEVMFGIIPAHAGNTESSRNTAPCLRDHPRACGEHHHGLVLGLRAEGSSPRMRGTPVPRPSVPRPSGIIPAHAGNTKYWLPRSARNGDHPRACGEHQVRDTMYGTTQGSSPRMRGTPTQQNRFMMASGIIPAHAGNTGVTVAVSFGVRDHPRACGEHFCYIPYRGSVQGSSPRMRGTRAWCLMTKWLDGIIPAHAGNTSASDSRR